MAAERSGRMSDDETKEVIVPLHKDKGSKMHVKSYREMYLFSISRVADDR